MIKEVNIGKCHSGLSCFGRVYAGSGANSHSCMTSSGVLSSRVQDRKGSSESSILANGVENMLYGN